MQTRTTAIIVDDHEVFRLGVLRALKSSKNIEIIGEAASRGDAINLVRELSPAVALLDISIPGNGIEAAREIRRLQPDIKIVMLTVSDSAEDVLEAFEVGASGYVLKGVDAPELEVILSQIGRGQQYLSPELGIGIFQKSASQNRKDSPSNQLSIKEGQVLQLIGSGLGNNAIAKELGCEVRTVKYHVSNILMKLKLKNRVELALLYRKSSQHKRPH